MARIAGQLFKAIGLKQPALKVYFFVHRSLHKTKFAFRKMLLPRLVDYRKRKGILAVDIRNDYGIGAKICWCLEIFKYCEEKELTPLIRFSYTDDHEDYFSNFFLLNIPGSANKKIKFTPFHFLDELGFPENYFGKLSLDEGTRLLNKYIQVNEKITSEAKDFYNVHFAGKKIIGVHYRGTDKTGEAPEVPYEKVLRNIEATKKVIGEADAVFLSTDDQHFAEYLILNMQQLPVIMRNDYKRSSDKQAVHINKSLNKYEVNRDAVVNMLLLSRCDFLIKSSSFLSDISKLMNPQLPVVMLNKPYSRALWFPAKEILKEMAFEPVA